MKNYKGLTNAEVLESRKLHGENKLTPPKKTPLWKLYLEKYKDPAIIILLVAAVVSLVVGFVEGSFIESIGIFIAIFIATLASFWMEYSAKKKFDILNQVSDTEPVKVIRNGEVTEVPKTELVVGDIVLISGGDEVPADIELLEALDIKVDESTMTGESVPVSKVAKSECPEHVGSGFAKYLILRSTKVAEGTGVGTVVAVGDETEVGKTTRAALEEVDEDTPLNRQLARLAKFISQVAFAIAGLMLIILNVHHFFFTDYEIGFMPIFTSEISYLMIALAVIVAVVSEGLPIATTISLAFSMKAMAKENNLVKKMHASETIGAVRQIMSDKTSTLTLGKMTVVDEHISDLERIKINIAINSTANLNSKGEGIGNPTECALLKHLKKLGASYEEIRNSTKTISQKPFNSTDKYMSTETEEGIYVKGAPEVIARMTGTNDFLEIVEKQQERGRRAISFAFGPSLESLTYNGSYFIEDPVRPDVPQAIKDCYDAGISVVMCTGDNIKTAKEIARQAGFKPGKDGEIWAIEAKEFDNIEWDQENYPTVIARCKPSDKLHILKAFQERYKGTDHEFVCAMTGDGTNDAPALNHADVGIAMGSGTSVAKTAADIVLLDDAFPSIVTGIKWGRSLYQNIRSFLIFQMSINLALCLVALAGPILGIDLPFNVIQILWANVCLDSLASLCLATEKVNPKVMLDKPRKQTDFILSKGMMLDITLIGVAFFAVMCPIVYDISHNNSNWFGIDLTGLFAIFMMLCSWNVFNIRVYGKGQSIFYNLGNNKYFIFGSLTMFIGTIMIVQFGGEVFGTHALDLGTWIKIIAATGLIVVVREVWYWVKKLF